MSDEEDAETGRHGDAVISFLRVSPSPRLPVSSVFLILSPPSPER